MVEGIRAVAEVPLELLEAVYYVAEAMQEGQGAALLSRLKSEATGAAIEEVTPQVLAAMGDTVTPQGILALVRMPQFDFKQLLGDDRRPAHIIILESLQDPGNLGTIVRTAEGAGATGIIMNRGTVDIYSPKVVRSTMGSIFRVPHYITEDLPGTIRSLKEDQGVAVYAAHLRGERSHDGFDYTGPTAFMIGNEGNGLTEETASLASQYLRIPMEGRLESLNASVAAAVLMYEANRQRRTT